MTGPPSPADNVIAVFAVLQQNWPNQFKRDVDQTDPAGVWKSNVGYFGRESLQRGLRELRTMDDKYMPNAPSCARIIKEANQREVSEAPPEPASDPVDQSAAQLWISYAMRMSIHRKQNITRGMGASALGEAKRIIPSYKETWNSEQDQTAEMFAALMEDMGGVLIKSWNEICSIGLKIETVKDLMAVGGK